MATSSVVTPTVSHVTPTAPSPSTVFDAESIKLEGDEDPRNWSPPRKWGTTAIISLMGFISPLGSSVIVPGTPIVDRHFQLQSRELSLLPVSFFVLGLGIGPFLLAPASELKGRQPIFLISCIVFVVFNVITAVLDNYGALCFFRFLAGAAGSTGPSLGAGSIGDLFAPRERGRAQSLYGLGPLLGPVCGAIAGGWLSQRAKSWRWLLWLLTILSALIAVIVAIFLRETYAPVLLRRKVERCRREHMLASAITRDQVQPPKSIVQRALTLLVPSRELRSKTRLALSRPFRLLFTNPICAMFSLYMGFIYGIIFIFITQHPLLFQRREAPDDPPPQRLPTYGWTTGLASLTYLGLGLGFLVAALINVLLQDELYSRLALSGGRVGWVLFCDKQEIVADALRRKHKLATAEQGTVMSSTTTALLQPTLLPQAPAPAAATAVTPTSVPEKAAAVPDVEKIGTLESASSCDAINAKLDTLKETANTSTPSWPEPGASKVTAEGLPTYTPHPQQQPHGAVAVAASTHPGRPEYRLPLCLAGMIILPCGLLVFGWTADARAHFMLPLVGSFLVGVGSILPFQAILVYLVDTFIPFSASATACAVFVRCVLAAVFPLFSQKLMISCGFGWGSTLLALISCLAIPVPIYLFRHGERLRKRFHFEG